ncbi:hypothetical protein H310_11829 [Aphanomyces invadans]|uniref:Microsomal glutathione S-transferase 1 n=1 Tax=Aphanomyces invadans TaxID=157072 RepID=A0A024TKK7_9STRA|nr:hypothetical protein H310_11829 [Aphanomyces invadans]ETV94529.1 hypothetical protein H310_11829 [Aphanomyces invadans]|eukprot:XP_008876844.1 hypothetical protein H310_11829 [Aphanomyces invadans]
MGALAGDVRVAALCTLVLYIKFYAALFVQGTVKYKSGSRPPEDMTFAATTAPNKELFIPETSEDKLEAAKAREHRWNRIVGNDLENLPLGIMMAWVAIVAGGNGTVTSIAIILFTVSRIAHSIAFANAMFLPRTISFQEIPESAALRDAERAVTCTHLINFLNRNHRQWLDGYLATRKSSYNSLLRLLQRCCHRHGFTRQKASKSKKTQADLEATRAEFAADFHKAFEGLEPDTVINVDETGMTYDMPPHGFWAIFGGTRRLRRVRRILTE